MGKFAVIANLFGDMLYSQIRAYIQAELSIDIE